MKLPGPTFFLTFTAVCLAAAGCVGTNTGSDSDTDLVKDMVMKRYDGFAATGGECSEK